MAAILIEKQLSGREYENNSAVEEVRIRAQQNLRESDVCIFSGCRNLKKVIFENSCPVIPANMFYGCGKLEEVVFPDDLSFIGHDAFAFCRSLKSAILPQTLEEAGERAFQGCSALENVYFGPRLCSAGADLFLHVPFIRDLVWMSPLPDHTFMYRRLPPSEQIYALAAPLRNPVDVKEAEMVPLACGYLFHDELSFPYEETYRQFILERFPEYLSLFSRRGILFDVLSISVQRNLIRDETVLKQYISFARKDAIDIHQKHYLDHLAVQAEDPDKQLLRKAASFIKGEPLGDVLPVHLSPVHHRTGTGLVPEEAALSVIYAYVTQKEPRIDHAADELASCFEQKEWIKALWNLCAELPVSPQYILPLARYGKAGDMKRMLEMYEEWHDYQKYGYQGYVCAGMFEKAALLSDTHEALRFCFRHALISSYANLREKTVFDLLCENEEADLLEEYHAGVLEDMFYSGRSIPLSVFRHEYLSHPALRKQTSRYLWQSGRTVFAVTDNGYADCRGRDAEVKDEVKCTHPLEADLSCWDSEYYSAAVRIHPAFYSGNGARKRYEGIPVRKDQYAMLNRNGFRLEGSPLEALHLYFRGKKIMEIHSGKLGCLIQSNCTGREMNAVLENLDRIFAYEMILDNRMSCRGYSDSFTDEEIQTLLQSAIAHGNHENTAVLLGVSRQGDGLEW
ncbi:MAG: leucine-rich repeat domain-containing protein [Solobacterium sp.]|nr:leucine-rich repeat domain-containing protein [Solobacterium sp.]